MQKYAFDILKYYPPAFYPAAAFLNAVLMDQIL